MLWFSWYGFNCGSTLGGTAGRAAQQGLVGMNTSLGAAGAAITAFLVHRFSQKGDRK